MSIRDEEPFDNIVNLTQLVVDVERGNFTNVREVEKEFNNIIKQVRLYRHKAVEAFNTQNNCQHIEYHTPKWSLRKNIFDYYYYFEKTCKCCGYVENTRLEEFSPTKDNYPEGFEGAEKSYYNLNI